MALYSEDVEPFLTGVRQKVDDTEAEQQSCKAIAPFRCRDMSYSSLGIDSRSLVILFIRCQILDLPPSVSSTVGCHHQRRTLSRKPPLFRSRDMSYDSFGIDFGSLVISSLQSSELSETWSAFVSIRHCFGATVQHRTYGRK